MIDLLDRSTREESGVRGGSLESQSFPWWQAANVLSLDAVAVGVIWNLLLSSALHLPIQPMVLVVLAGAVWFIYLLDHVLDVKKVKPGTLQTARKAFIGRHHRFFTRLAVGGMLFTAVLAWFYLKPAVFQFGVAAGAIVVLYMAAIHLLPTSVRQRWPREGVVALIFAAGVCMPVGLESETGLAEVTLGGLLFFLLCWINVSAAEVWEWQETGRTRDTAPNDAARWVTDRIVGLSALLVALSAAITWTGVLPFSFTLAVLISSSANIAIARMGMRARPGMRSVLIDLALCSPFGIVLLLWRTGL